MQAQGRKHPDNVHIHSELGLAVIKAGMPQIIGIVSTSLVAAPYRREGSLTLPIELGVTEIGCMAHARRKFFELHATNKSQPAKAHQRRVPNDDCGLDFHERPPSSALPGTQWLIPLK